MYKKAVTDAQTQTSKTSKKKKKAWSRPNETEHRKGDTSARTHPSNPPSVSGGIVNSLTQPRQPFGGHCVRRRKCMGRCRDVCQNRLEGGDIDDLSTLHAKRKNINKSRKIIFQHPHAPESWVAEARARRWSSTHSTMARSRG